METDLVECWVVEIWYHNSLKGCWVYFGDDYRKAGDFCRQALRAGGVTKMVCWNMMENLLWDMLTGEVTSLHRSRCGCDKCRR